MMTLEEAIKHCKDVALSCTNKECALEHFQLLKWLQEYSNMLEKHGEQKPVDKVEPKFHEGDIMRTLEEAKEGITNGLPVVVSIDEEYYHCNNEIISIKDQDDYEFPPINMKKKPAWSEEDEYCRHQLIVFCENCMVPDSGAKRCAHWLKALKDRVYPQPKQEWSEEDKKIIDRIESEFLALHRGDYKNIDFNDVSSLTVLNWVRKIKSLRFQSTWKPSEFHLGCITDAISMYKDRGINAIGLKEVLDELKKLKEE